MPRQVFIVEDHGDMRDAYRLLLEQEPDLAICGQAASAEEALPQLSDRSADLVIVDLSLPRMSGIELIHVLQARHGDLPVLVISGHDEAHYVARALTAGARGYIDKSDVNNIGEAIRQVLQGHVYLSDNLQR